MRRCPSSLLPSPKFPTLILCVLIFSTLSFAAVADRITSSINSARTVQLTRSVNSKARPEFDQGAVDPQFKLSYVTLLTSPSASQQKALNQLLAQQQDRKSPNYHKWLTPQEYADRFGLSQNDINKITVWLSSQGFQVLSVGGGRNSVIFSGTAAQLERSFGTQIHNYNVNGVQHFANSMPFMLPAALRGIVTTVMGLHDFRPLPARRVAHSEASGRIHPEYFDGDFIFPNFLAPGDVATIYDINPLYDAATPVNGAGQQLAIVGQTDIYLADISDFRNGFSLPAISNCTVNGSGILTSCSAGSTYLQYVLIGTDPGVPSPGDLSESDLDIEWSGAVARNAQIIFVNAETANGVFDALDAVINPPSGPPIAPVVSMSYGQCEAAASFDLEMLLQQGNAEGVTIVNSSGDAGAATCDRDPNSNRPFTPAIFGLAVSYPASSPEVTGVGGTAISLANDSYPTPSAFWSTTIGPNGGTAVCPGGSCVPELSWNDDEELAQYCHSPISGDKFCSQGGPTAVPGWVALTTSATAAQVQSDIWISQGGGGASNCWYETPQAVCLGAGPGPNGGGFAQPLYQQGLSVSGAPAGVRYVPDVSLFASPDFPGYIFCTAQSEIIQGGTSTSSCVNGIADAVNTFESIVGGTSASAPAFAGIVTLLNQQVIVSGLQDAPGLGNINTNLYLLAASNPSAFHQVTTGDNMVYCQPNTPAGEPVGIVCPAGGVFGYQASNKDSATGYNLVTGLGSVDASNFLQAWVSTVAPDFAIAVTATPSTVAENKTVVWNGTLTAANGYNNTVALSCTAIAPPTCTISPASLVPTAAGAPFTMTVGGGTTPQTYTFGVQGTDGTITQSQALSLTVSQDFNVPPTLTAPSGASPGQLTSTSMSISTVGGAAFNANVTYTCPAGLPAGATCSFSPTTIAAGTASPATVTVNVQTSGPFTGTAGDVRRGDKTGRRMLGQKERLWLPMSLPLFGMVLVGLTGGRLPRRYKIVGLCLILTLTGFLVACGGSSSPPPPVVTVSPNAVSTLYPNLAGAPPQTQQFSATVSNTTSQTVTWAVTGGSANGSIDATGLYTAPAALPNPNSPITVTATSAATTTPGTATVNLQTPTPSGAYPITVTVTAGGLSHTTTFTLTVN